MSERRYRDEEVREIFELATRDQPSPGATPADGLTLSQLQEIGRDVGLSPERIARAAAALDRPPEEQPRRSLLGAPIAVSRSVALPRAPTEREWEVLLAELRETFQAQGKTGGVGDSRHWRNGNLHAYVEPTEGGYRLRLGTLKSGAEALGWLSLGGFLVGLVLAIISAVAGVATGFESPVTLAVVGAAGLGFNALRLRPWARTREQQMEYIAARAVELVGSGEHDASSEGSGAG